MCVCVCNSTVKVIGGPSSHSLLSHTLTQSPLHTLTPSHNHLSTPSHNHLSTPSHPHTITSPHPHTLTQSHLHTLTQSPLHTLTPSHNHLSTPSHPHLPVLGPLRPVQLGVALIAHPDGGEVAKVAQSYLVLGTVIAEDTTTRSIHTEQGNSSEHMYNFLHRFCISFSRLGLSTLFQISIVTCVVYCCSYKLLDNDLNVCFSFHVTSYDCIIIALLNTVSGCYSTTYTDLQ